MSKAGEEHVQRTCGMIEVSIGKMSAKGQCGGSTEQVSVKTWALLTGLPISNPGFVAHVLKLSTKIPVVATMKELNNPVEMKPAGRGTFVT